MNIIESIFRFIFVLFVKFFRVTLGLFVLFIVLYLFLFWLGEKDSGEPTQPVAIINKSSHDICGVWFPISGSFHLPTKNLLQESLFHTRKLLSGKTITVYVAQGFYDVRIETCDGLGSGTDYFKVPPNDKWTISDDQLTPIVR